MLARKQCEICQTSTLVDYQISSRVIKSLKSNKVQVTNKDYGVSIQTVICIRCKLVQPKYLLLSNDLVNLYSEMDDRSYLQTSEQRGKSNYSQIKEYINDFNRSAKILEIGSGSGSLLHLISQNFPNSYGIEPSYSFYKFSKNKYNLTIENIGYENLDTKKKYDIIVALDVIEHVASPNFFFKVVAQIIKPNGRVIIGTPNINSITARLLNKKWWHIRPAHIFYFNNKNFQQLANKHSFKILHIKPFTWNLPFNYLFDSIQKLIIGRSLISLGSKNLNFKLNTFDSNVFILTK